MSLALELRRLAKHSAIYGAGGIASRLLTFLLLPLYTAYLGTRGFGKIELLAASSSLVVALLTGSIVNNAFFRFYFTSSDPAYRLLLLRTAYWSTMAMATAALALGLAFAKPLAHVLGLGDDPGIVKAGAVGLWAQMNWNQLVNLYRVEERAAQFVLATLANVIGTAGMTVVFVVVLHYGATGAVLGSFLSTLAIYLFVMARRRDQLGMQFDVALLRRMYRFGLPLVPSLLAIWAINLVDRMFVVHYNGLSEAGVYSLAVRISNIVVFILVAFRLAWSAFAYQIEDDARAKRAYAHVLTYVVFLCCWISVAIATLAPWIVRIAAPSQPGFWRAEKAVGLLAFGASAYAGYTVIGIAAGRTRRTGYHWIVTGIAGVLNIALNFVLIPRYGMVGASVSTAAAYVALFFGITIFAQRIFPTPYQWRRVAMLSCLAVGLSVVGYEMHSVALSIALSISYPLLLLPLGFYLPSERLRLRSVILRQLRVAGQRG